MARCRCGTVFALPAESPVAGLLACPRCGASVSASGHRCEFCRAELLVRTCPRCTAHVFHGHQHCPHCGAATEGPAIPASAVADEGHGGSHPAIARTTGAHAPVSMSAATAAAAGRARTDTGSPTPAAAASPLGDARRHERRCPRCTDPLLPRLIGDVLFDECPVCAGVFVDVAALERLLSERQQARAEAVLGAYSLSGFDALTPPPGPIYIKCPDCKAVMNRRQFARGAKCIVDVCKHHGSWFDAGELPRVIQFAMNGGLERAEKAELAEQREQVRRARAEAIHAQQMALRAGTGIDVRSSRGVDRFLDLLSDLLT
jgi:Zn-finger nucleic acid-binding protein